MSSEEGFPKPVGEVVATLAAIFHHQGRSEIHELLENSHARFDQINYDNWNGGTYTWALRLEVPIAIFAPVEHRLTKIEKEIEAKLKNIARVYQNNHIGEVTITPVAPGSPLQRERMAPSEVEVRRLWPEKRFRLFLSHVSKYKTDVSKLKDELALFGVAAFVAHEDIEPTSEWRNEIKIALRSMHALAALITPDFHASPWTDQEIGWSLGRGIQVISVRLGADPYGFAGEYQGISGALDKATLLATDIVKTLLANTQTHSEIRRSLVSAFTKAGSYEMAKRLKSLIVEIKDFTEEEKEILIKACTENSQVADAFGVFKAIYAAFGKTPESKPEKVEHEIPF